MKKNERIVLYYDLSIMPKSRSFPAPKTITVKKAFEMMELVAQTQMTKEMSAGKEYIYVSDWNWTDDIISVLINKSDQRLSDPVFTVPQENKRRTIEKTVKEGQDFSAHLVIKLPTNDQEPALLLIESSLGLGMFMVKQLFNQILKNAKAISPDDFEQLHPDGSLDNNGKPKKYSVNFQCELQGHISNELKDDLEHGKVQFIELITDKDQYSNFDDDGYIKEKCKIIALTLKDETHPIQDKLDRILKVFDSNKNDYNRAKIKFRTSAGVPRTVEMNTAEALAIAYVKKEKLDGFEIDLKSSYDEFYTPILNKMKELLT